MTGGCPLVSPLVGRWSFDYLAEHFGGFDGVAVHFSPRENTCFSRLYGEGLGKGGCTNMTFAQFAEVCQRDHLAPKDGRPESKLRYYLNTPLVWNEREASDPHGPPRIDQHQPDKPMSKCPFGPQVEADLNGLGWQWLARARQLTGCLEFDTCQLWAGHGGGSTPTHFDSLSNFLAQVAGRKQVLLFPPSQTWQLYPYPVKHPMDNFAMVDVENPDVGRFPALVRAKALEAILEPGDVLWLPRFYWHYVHQLDAPSENLSLNFWIGRKGTEEFCKELREAPLPGPELVAAATTAAAAVARQMEADGLGRQRVETSDEALLEASPALAMKCLHAARMIESAAAHLMGDDQAKGNHFLAALAAGSDGFWPPDTSAYKSAQTLRKELIAVLGEDGASALIRMSSRDGRLHPGLAPFRSEGSPFINSEKGGWTPPDELRRWFSGTDLTVNESGGDVARVIAAHGSQ